MATMSWASGDTITASRLQDMVPILAVKGSFTARTSTTTLADDPDLVVTLRAGVTYVIELDILAIGSTTGDLKIAYSNTGTVSDVWVARTTLGPATTLVDPRDSGNINIGAFNAAALTTTQAYGTGGTTNRIHVYEKFVVQGGASGGNLALQWAQNVSDGTATTITKGILLATPVNKV